MSELIQKIRQRVTLPLPGAQAQLKMAPLSRIDQLNAPANAIKSAVMILLFEKENQWFTLLMHRTEDGRTHGGQISFPGGKQELYDSDLTATATRECQEEIGISPQSISILGALTSLYIPPSNFQVTPVIGYLAADPEIRISPREVQSVMPVSLSFLFDDRIKESRLITTSSGLQLESPVYVLSDGKIVWGATAMIISELEHLLKEIN
ncbi:MAG: CoA pyrophosphatase [Chitinophagaceae bacterium]|nr:CoA pyrophosphatase [Chitinophagaceae bacterium]